MSNKKKKAGALPVEHWMNEPEVHDYSSAFDYLSLVVEEPIAKATANSLERGSISHREAKDLLRSSGLALLPKNNFHVQLDLKKVADGKKLSPVLLVRGSLAKGAKLTIADGYHRICASYYVQEDATIPCRIVDFSVPNARQRTTTTAATK